MAPTGATLTATGGALLLTGGVAELATTGPITLDATGGALALSGTAALLEVGTGIPPPVIPQRGAGPGPPLVPRDLARRLRIENQDFLDIAVILVEIINAGR